MNTLSIKDLRDFLNLYHRETRADEADSFVLTSKKYPDCEIVLENHEDMNDEKVWDIRIDKIDSNERSFDNWLEDYELLHHDVSKFEDWEFAKYAGDLLETLILKVQWQISSDFNNAIKLVRTNRKVE